MSVALEFKDFCFAYPRETHAPQAGEQWCIGPVDWCVEDGAFVVLSGDTGSGKTTLLRCAKPELAFEGERRGQVLVNGCDAASLSVAESAQLVGYVAQSPDNQLICDTVWHQMAFGLENLATPQAQMRRRVAEVAHFFGMEPWFNANVNDLSGGQKQLVNLASILVMQPRLLLLDEPTAQLDPVAEKNFLHALFRLNRELGMTVVVVTHAPQTVREYATHEAFLKHGRVTCAPVSRMIGEHAHASTSANATLEGGVPGSAEGAASDSVVAPAAATGSVLGAGASVDRERPVVRLADVHFAYSRTADPVLRGMDLAVGRGSIHALVGGNGCGKSTLLRVIAKALKPQRGRADNRLADRQALLPQDPKALFVCDTVDEELREWQRACGYSDQDISDYLELFGLTERRFAHPYDLSGGQQQLLAFAKVLLTDPDLLLLDEPTKGLDVTGRIQVARALLLCAAQGATVVLATHDLAFAQAVATTATMLFDGQDACTQPVGTFFCQNLFYRPMPDAFSRAWDAELEWERACQAAQRFQQGGRA